jgi:flagellar biosynthetic protein FliP
MIYAILFLISFITPTMADPLSLDLNGVTGSFSGRLIQLFLLFTVLSVAPSLIIMVTSFTRIVVVLSFLRNAIGLQQSPPNMVIISLAVFLTGFVMGPTLETAYHEGVAPLVAEKIKEDEAIEKTSAPFHAFMLKNVREKDLELFTNLSNSKPAEEAKSIPFRVLIPAFMISELRRAFEIGFLIFIPFLIIDLVVASILMSMGMMMLPPVMISLPFKIIFFVLLDGWFLLSGSLVNSFNTT